MKPKKWFTILFISLVILAIGLTILSFFIELSPTKAKNNFPQAAWDAFSSERMYATLEDLTSIQAHSGWRGSATDGEKEALDYLEERLSNLDWLIDSGMTLERESFHVFLATQDHTSSLFLSEGTTAVEIPADSVRGHRDDLDAAVRLDSDGVLRDLESDPVSVEGEIVFIQNKSVFETLIGQDFSGKVLMVDYSLVDTGTQTYDVALPVAQKLLDMKPAAIVLVTEFSNVIGSVHGTFIGDGGGGFQKVSGYETVPLLFIEMENLEPLAIENWDQMKKLTSAKVVWDQDVSNPATSGNLIVHIPGKDKERPVLISAHIDSPNSPGAMDNGSGSAILMEIATVLNQEKLQPETDVYLAWYGSEELGLYGSTYFTTTHSDLINQLQANIQIDCLTRPLDTMTANINLSFSHYVSSVLEAEPLAKYLIEQGSGIDVIPDLSYWPFSSDNGSLTAFHIPNVNIIYESDMMANTYAGVWYTGHMHDPYDTVTLAREMDDVFTKMGKLGMSAAFVPSSQEEFVKHTSDKKVVFLANHTESPHMTPTGFPEMSLAFIRAGYAVSVAPYGEPLTPDTLAGTDLVVVLPAYDYPAGENASAEYDTNWSVDEAKVLDDYAKEGGTILVVNSTYRLKLYNRMYDANEDWADLNVVTDQWGVHFTQAGVPEDQAPTTAQSGITDNVFRLFLQPMNAVTFTIENGEVLASAGGNTHLARVSVGTGSVIILSDMTVLGEGTNGLTNRDLVMNLTKLK